MKILVNLEFSKENFTMSPWYVFKSSKYNWSIQKIQELKTTSLLKIQWKYFKSYECHTQKNFFSESVQLNTYIFFNFPNKNC